MQICGEDIYFNRDYTYSLLALLSEHHGGLCKQIGECHDMEEATRLATELPSIVRAYNSCERHAAVFDSREPNLLDYK